MAFMRLIFIWGFLSFSFYLYSQNNNWHLYGGTTTGGPMPIKKEENSYAKLKHGVSSGLNYTYFRKNNLSLSAEVSFQFIHLHYGQNIKKDTTVQINIPLQNGGSLTTNINTYYKADIDGIMILNFFKLGSNMTYNFKKYNFSFGAYLSTLTGGYDKGTVHVTIGEGGVNGLDDINQNFNNNANINNYCFEIILRTERQIFKKLSANLQLSRGITPFYNKNFLVNGKNIKFYTTIIAMNILYEF